MRKLLLLLPIVLICYALFWFDVFQIRPPVSTPVSAKNTSQIFQTLQKEEGGVLSATTSAASQLKDFQVPTSYLIPLPPRKQVFNLSCEFAVAASITHYFTGAASFAADREESAEKMLMEKVGISQNPNVGIRMGDILQGDFATLYKNLNNKFGGTDYYGIHAPPFLSLFPQFGLIAKPIFKDENTLVFLKRAVSQGHLVMAWIHIGFGAPVDVALAYGTVPIVKGEHVVAIVGYDENAFVVMDPAIGAKRTLSFDTLLSAASPFALPFVEIYRRNEVSEQMEFEEISAPTATPIPREKLVITVANGSGKIGKGTQLADILRDFGYALATVKNADNADYEDLTIKMKESRVDFKELLVKDLELASYKIATVSSNLSENDTSDAVITIGN